MSCPLWKTKSPKTNKKGNARSKPYEFEKDTTLPSLFCALSDAGIVSLQTEESLKDVILQCCLCKTSLKENAQLKPEELIPRHSISKDFESRTDVTVERGGKKGAVPSPEFTW